MNSTGKVLSEKVLQFLNEQNVAPGSSMLIGLSGGPDSTALLYAMHFLSTDYPLNLGAAYVNHGLRESSELTEDDNFVRDLTDRLAIPLYERHAEPDEIDNIAIRESRSVEEVARRIRYDFFDKVMAEHDLQFLLVGHNWDDQMETIITRMFQGSDFQGLKGIPHRNGNILRPLIHCSRREILQFLDDLNADYRIDPTNLENDYQRNRVRNQLFPLLREIFPGIDRALHKQEKRFTSMDNLIDAEADMLPVRKTAGRSTIPLELFNGLNDFVRLRVLFRLFDFVYKGNKKDFRVPSAFFNPLIGTTIESDRFLADSYGVSIRTDNNSLIVEESLKGETGFFALIDEGELSIAGMRVKNSEKGTRPLFVCSDSPLIFRSSRPRDVIVTEKRKISLQDLSGKENPVAILEDSHGLVAVFGEINGGENFYRKKITNAGSNFNILYLEVEKEEKVK